MRYFSPREGDNPVMVLGGAFRVGLHDIRPEHFTYMLDDGYAYCPRYLEEEHPQHRENCYLCDLYQMGRRDLRERLRFFWPVLDLSVPNPSELGLQWFTTAMVNTERLSMQMVGSNGPKAINIIRTGVGMTMRYDLRDIKSRHPFTYTPIAEIPFPDLVIYSEAQMGRLFVDPYTLDYPRGLA